MRHRKSGRKLGRDAAHRKAMMRNMVTSLFEHGAIRTTDQKAKELRRLAAKMVTLGKKDSLHARRMAAKTIRSREVLVKLFDEIAPGYSERHGGYTRIIKLGRRRGDNAEMSMIELMPAGVPELKTRVRPVAPSVKVAAPASKEVFEETTEAAPAQADDATVVETAAVVEEAVEVAAEEPAAEEAVEAAAEEPAAEEAVEAAAEEPAAEEPAAEEAVAAAAEEPAAEEAVDAAVEDDATVLETPAIVEEQASDESDESKDEA